ncbi:hypothetical protein [Pseudomonas protegens]|uniref:hypothetical protein n=1 Tax=Pseudomonas protegens TaxID=380021 RepID=UPI0021B07653|nr:hypothetical protein [Pseudomonas protegens]
MVTRNSLMLSRRHGVFTALGIGLGVMLHIGYGGIIVLVHVLWFVAVALFFSAPFIASRLLGYRRRIDQVFGVVLVGFGLLLSVLSLQP